jgi:hypothetical protein
LNGSFCRVFLSLRNLDEEAHTLTLANGFAQSVARPGSDRELLLLMPAMQRRVRLRQLWREQPIKPKGAAKWKLEMQLREGRVTAAALNATALDAHSDIRVDPDDI